ncbi:excisionase [Methanosarcinales archaeon]|nr:MAG: excisionase [Methanosarcinales archaeon]
MKMQKVLLTTREIANLLRISPSTIARYRRLGLIPYIKLPTGKVRFDQREIIKWIEEKRVSGI